MPRILWCVAFALLTCPVMAQSNDIQPEVALVRDSLPGTVRQFHLPYSTEFLRTDSIPLSVFQTSIDQKTKNRDKQTLSLRSVIVPSAMIAYGAFTFTNRDLKKLNLSIRSKLWEDRNDGNGKPFRLDNFTLVAPAVAVYALNIAGVKGKNNLVDASLIYGMSHLIGQMLIVNNVKKLTDIMRPDSSNRLSFPSGHTAQAFLAAHFFQKEYGRQYPWAAVGMYTIASGIAVSRVLNNRHWASDVFAGAGIGMASVELSYLRGAHQHAHRYHPVILPSYSNGIISCSMLVAL